jgi:methyl-accepting chemotaxis protein
MKFSNLKIATKLSLAFGVLVLFILLLSAASQIQNRTVGNLMKIQNDLRTQKLERLYAAREALDQTGLAARNAYVFPDDARANSELDQVDREKALYLSALNALAPQFTGNADFAKVQKGLLQMAEELKRPRQYRSEKKMAEYGEFLVNECSPLRRQIVADMDVVLKSVQVNVDAQGVIAEKSIASSSVFTMAVSAIAVLLSVAIAWLTSRSITRPINEAVKVAQTVAAGDLTSCIVVNSKDETGQLLQALKDMNGSLATMVAEVRTGTETIATASSEIASGNLDLSSRTEQQAASLEETASSMEELTSTVRQNTDSAAQGNRMAVAASEVAARGGLVVSKVVDTMTVINRSANRIADIIGVIDSIAFQTNILALNAAVEAARAGEQGRGFAVVATEVRNLAQRSAAAAREIKGLITESVENVEAGTRLASEAGSTMGEIVDSICRVTDIMGTIAAASAEQNAGIEQVNQAVSQMDAVTQQNAALVEQAAAATESLRDQASSLTRQMSVFKISVVASHALAQLARPAPSRTVALLR